MPDVIIELRMIEQHVCKLSRPFAQFFQKLECTLKKIPLILGKKIINMVSAKAQTFNLLNQDFRSTVLKVNYMTMVSFNCTTKNIISSLFKRQFFYPASQMTLLLDQPNWSFKSVQGGTFGLVAKT